MLINIHIAVIAGADNIEILLFLTGCKAAGAGTVPVPLLVFQQAADQVLYKFRIRVKPVPAINCILFQRLVCPVNIPLADTRQRSCTESLPYLLFLETDNALSGYR